MRWFCSWSQHPLGQGAKIDTQPKWLKLIYLMHNTKTMIYQIFDPLTIRVCGRGSHVRGRGYSKMVNEEDQHQLWSLTFEKISKTYSGTYFRVFEKKKGGLPKAKLVLWNVQFPILCTFMYEPIFKSFYYLYYTPWPNKNASILFGIILQKLINRNEKSFHNNNS